MRLEHMDEKEIKEAIENDELELVSDYDMEKMYEEMLDEVYPECKIAGMEYSTSRALKEMDPTAYRCGMNDWLDNEISDGRFVEYKGEYYQEA